MRRTSAVALALGAVALAPAGAQASITVGSDLNKPTIAAAQTCAPEPSPCTKVVSFVTADNLYPAVSPATGTITAFTVKSGSADTMTFRVVKVGTDGQASGAGTGPTVTLPGAGTHTYPTSLAIEAGDRIGIDSSLGRTFEALPCAGSGHTNIYYPVLANAGPFQVIEANSICETLVNATIEPSNVIKVKKLKRNTSLGTGTLKVIVPGPGDLIVAGKNVQAKQAKAIGTKVNAAGPVTLKVKPVGRGRKKMRNQGKLSSKLRFTYTPDGGAKAISNKKVKLKLKN